MYGGVEMHVCMEEWRCTCVWRSGDARVYGGVEMHVCMEEWRCTYVWRSGDAHVYGGGAHLHFDQGGGEGLSPTLERNPSIFVRGKEWSV